MLHNFFRSKAPLSTVALPPGYRIYSIGDVHGRFDLLTKIAEMIDSDLNDNPVEKTASVFLGDYIDRGPRSASVLSFLADQRWPTPAVYLRGNHEEMLLQFLDDPEQSSHWLSSGGVETLHSYGVDVRQARLGKELPEACQSLKSNIPLPHLEFLAKTVNQIRIGSYFFCHAGVRPKVPLDRQLPKDLLWIREPFLSYRGDLGAIVVHGHSPVMRPEVLPNRINIDTGAYISGCLTSLVLEEDRRRFLFTT